MANPKMEEKLAEIAKALAEGRMPEGVKLKPMEADAKLEMTQEAADAQKG